MANLVNPIVDIISRLWTCCARHMRYLCKLQENKNLLRNAMDKLKDLRNDVKRKVVVEEEEADLNEPKNPTEQVRGWLDRVHTIEGEVEKIMLKADAQLSRARCLGGSCPPNNCCSNYKLGKSIAKKIPLVVELKGEGKFEVVTYRLPPPSVQDINLVSTVGMESMLNNVWRLINNSTDDKPVRIMGLYGSGGVGKTTLLEKINNEFNKDNDHDHVVIFAVVSKPINVYAIQTQIGERLRLSLQGDERRRANEIFHILRNKKFVILLDDLWERVDLECIGIPSPLTQCNSSKVIFTTRSQKVCGNMEATHTFQVECLPWDTAWSLFQDKVGETVLNYLSEVGEAKLATDVAKECDGLPLALITIGRAMSTKNSVEEWRDAITTLRSYASKFEGMSDKVLARLKLSYDNLSDESEKSCFRYCSLYPKNYSIGTAKLVDLWIAEGFLDGFDKNLDEARDRGHTIFGSLKSACLLSSEKNGVKMHDVIRDLALWIINDCKSSSSTTDKRVVNDHDVARIFCNSGKHGDSNNNDLEWEEPPTSLNLQTLVVPYSGKISLSLPQSFFQFTPLLRVLDMSCTDIKELPTSIGQLSDLQYLNLSNTSIKELPIELKKLVKLKFLDLNCARLLKKIPPGVIANLYDLQVLKLRGSGFKDWGLKEEDGGLSLGELDRLKQLQEVALSISTPLALEELLCNQKLQRIFTDLELKSCVNLKSISLLSPSMSTTTSKGGLGNLICLKYLYIENCEELEELIFFINDEGRVDISNNNNKLNHLVLRYLPRLNNIVLGEKYHQYGAATQQQHYIHYASPFQNLHWISIESCDALKDLTWIVYVENLQDLVLDRCNGLETIIELGDDHGLEGGDQILFNTGGGCRVFEKLKNLHMWGLPNLKSICSHALVFPSIEMISIRDCPELKKLPLDSRSNINNTLYAIIAEPIKWNELQWEDETIKSKFLPYWQKRYKRRR